MRTEDIPNFSHERNIAARQAMDFLFRMMQRQGVITTMMFDYGVPAVIQAMASAEAGDPAVLERGLAEIERKIAEKTQFKEP
jgi:hypothetical protein